MSSTTTITILPVTDPTEIPVLASIFDHALIAGGDGFHTIMERYSGHTVYEDTIEKLEKALKNPDEAAFKAVEVTRASNGEVVKEEIVGVSQWFVGFIDLPKHDPFSPPSGEAAAVPGLPPVAIPVSEQGASRPETASAMPREIDFYGTIIRPIVNIYISNIRGKRHVYLRRMAVLPTHQRRGIASRLLQWGVDVADEGKMVGYLNARPMGRPLYEKAGWKAITELDMSLQGLEVEAMVPMIRPRRE